VLAAVSSMVTQGAEDKGRDDVPTGSSDELDEMSGSAGLDLNPVLNDDGTGGAMTDGRAQGILASARSVAQDILDEWKGVNLDGAVEIAETR